MAMFAHFRMSPGGDVFPCSGLRGETAGNAAAEPFSSLWRGPRADAVRRKVLSCPGCWIECDVNPSVFFSGDVIPWFVRRAASDKEFRRRYFVATRGRDD
jgi:MoaA/NifB/PqqE/SkfB family radical SAM enzyme